MTVHSYILVEMLKVTEKVSSTLDAVAGKHSRAYATLSAGSLPSKKCFTATSGASVVVQDNTILRGALHDQHRERTI